MNHTDHVNLLQDGISEPGGVWADFGSGSGAFTLALAELLGPGAQIYSVDKKKSALRRQELEMSKCFLHEFYSAVSFKCVEAGVSSNE